ncbi:tetratricopeptide repeat protein [Kitasatospora sp. NPDC051853]|uniref:tetratricopeptide repeat protein n=1 Tax=Kitasatospora sp. NPDC051853 TaxID=3364058 RepID=UPI0037B8BD0C
MSNRAATAGIGLARVLAHCGGDLAAAVHHLAGAIAAAPGAPEAYAALAELREERRADLAELLRGGGSLRTVLAHSYVSFLEADMDNAVMSLGSVTGAQPTIAWADAPWFTDPRFLGTVSADALAEAVMRTTDHGHALDAPGTRDKLRPWFGAIDAVCAREPVAEAMARMAIFLRSCGLTDASLDLCDRADSVERTMLTEVVRAGTWRRLGDPERAAAAFGRALTLDPTNWSLHLDLADLRAEQGDFPAAADLVLRGLAHEPAEVTLRAARAAYSARATGSPDDLRELIALAPDLPKTPYRDVLIDHACAGPALPAGLIAEVRRFRSG